MTTYADEALALLEKLRVFEADYPGLAPESVRKLKTLHRALTTPTQRLEDDAVAELEKMRAAGALPEMTGEQADAVSERLARSIVVAQAEEMYTDAERESVARFAGVAAGAPSSPAPLAKHHSRTQMREAETGRFRATPFRRAQPLQGRITAAIDRLFPAG